MGPRSSRSGRRSRAAGVALTTLLVLAGASACSRGGGNPDLASPTTPSSRATSSTTEPAASSTTQTVVTMYLQGAPGTTSPSTTSTTTTTTTTTDPTTDGGGPGVAPSDDPATYVGQVLDAVRNDDQPSYVSLGIVDWADRLGQYANDIDPADPITCKPEPNSQSACTVPVSGVGTIVVHLLVDRLPDPTAASPILGIDQFFDN